MCPPLRVGDLGGPVGVGVPDGVEGPRVGDSVVDHVGQLAGVAQRPFCDGGAQDDARVVSGEFGAAQGTAEGAGAVLGGDPRPLLVGERAGVGEVVEPAGGASGGGELAGVGE